MTPMMNFNTSQHAVIQPKSRPSKPLPQLRLRMQTRWPRHCPPEVDGESDRGPGFLCSLRMLRQSFEVNVCVPQKP